MPGGQSGAVPWDLARGPVLGLSGAGPSNGLLSASSSRRCGEIGRPGLKRDLA